MFSGTLRTRDRLRFGPGLEAEGKVTGVSTFNGGEPAQPGVSAGQIAKLYGLSDVRVGDRIGEDRSGPALRSQFAPPTLEAVIVPRDHSDGARLRVALDQLAEQDPLINVHQDPTGRE